MKEEVFTEGASPSRKDADRLLRSYKRISDVIRSSHTYGRRFDALCPNEAVLQSEIFAIRSAILSLSDIKEKTFLYNYYVRGLTLEKCARLLGVSLRTVSRIKNSALDKITRIMTERNLFDIDE